ncbi:MAG: hypothetical protein JNL24_01600 [Bacteroidia bacterium]|nr:hypothetical protein [Bacteroidia bacterium]
MKIVLKVFITVIAFTTVMNAQTSSTSTVLGAYQKNMKYFTSGSGAWESVNQDNDPKKEDGFKEFRIEFKALEGGFGMNVKVLGVRNDNKKVVFWNIYSYYDAETKTIKHLQLGTGGDSGAGTETIMDDKSVSIHMNMCSFEGTKWEFKDEGVVVNENEWQSTTLMKNKEGEWKVTQKSTWKKI